MDGFLQTCSESKNRVFWRREVSSIVLSRHETLLHKICFSLACLKRIDVNVYKDVFKCFIIVNSRLYFF
jgi:hypothetical protein